jgi:glutathione S-transferase
MVHGDIVLTESYAIMHYLRSLSDKMPYDDYQLSVAGRAMYDQWLSFLLMELDATSLYVVRRHKDLHEIYGEAPAAVASSLAYFERMVNSVADEIQPDKPIWGNCFSELDILLTIALDWGSLLDCDLPEGALAYREFMRGREAYGAARLHNFRDLQLPTAPTS